MRRAGLALLLLELLLQGHEEVRLAPCDLERLITWMDTYGQRRGAFSEDQEDRLREAVETAVAALNELLQGRASRNHLDLEALSREVDAVVGVDQRVGEGNRSLIQVRHPRRRQPDRDRRRRGLPRAVPLRGHGPDGAGDEGGRLQ